MIDIMAGSIVCKTLGRTIIKFCRLRNQPSIYQTYISWWVSTGFLISNISNLVQSILTTRSKHNATEPCPCDANARSAPFSEEAPSQATRVGRFPIFINASSVLSVFRAFNCPERASCKLNGRILIFIGISNKIVN